MDSRLDYKSGPAAQTDPDDPGALGVSHLLFPIQRLPDATVEGERAP
jgi:hypothetical protein